MKIRFAGIAIALCLWSVVVVPLRAQDAGRRAVAGRPLAEALREFQARGLRIVFSSELVRADMRVTVEPHGGSDRQVVDEILRPHGLETRAGPRSTLIVVQARAPAARAPLAADAGAIIRGIVLDARSATPLPGVVVRLATMSRRESVTDTAGRFEIAGVAAGHHTLFASLVGYTLARPNVEVRTGMTLDVSIALTAGVGTFTEEVTVTAAEPFREAQPTVPSVMVLNGADLLELRGVLSDDPLRAIQTLPGVTGGNDFRSEFSVRGSDYRHLGLSIDGMPAEWPIHTVRGDPSGGSVSLINADIVDRVGLLNGGYPQDVPARTGAWLDFSIREGSRSRPQIRGALSMTSASLIFEGPIGTNGRGSWLVATRQSFVQWIIARMGSSGSTAFGFTDMQGKVVYDMSPTQRLEVTAVGGGSRLDLQRVSTDPNLIGRGAANALLSTATWRTIHDGNLTVTQRASTSAYGFGNDRVDGVPLAHGSGHSAAYRPGVVWMARPSTMLQAGAYVRHESVDERTTHFIEDPSRRTAVPRDEAVSGSRVLWSADARTTYSGRRGLAVDAGMLISRATSGERSPAASPWFGVSVPLTAAFTFTMAGGDYRQQPSLEQTFAGSFGGNDVRTERARQVDATLERRWGSTARVQVTGYSRREHGMLRLMNDEYRLTGGVLVPPALTPHWANALEGSSSGLEVLVQRRAVAGLSGWLSYGYSRTVYDDRTSRERFVADFDERHTFNAYAQRRLSPVTGLSAKLRIGSNGPIPGYLDQRPDGLFVGDARNRVRLPSYARLDVRANRAFNFETRRLTLFVEVVNLLGRANYAPGYAAMRVLPNGAVLSSTQRLFPFLPTAGLLVEF
jgi:hypothetical protein